MSVSSFSKGAITHEVFVRIYSGRRFTLLEKVMHSKATRALLDAEHIRLEKFRSARDAEFLLQKGIRTKPHSLVHAKEAFLVSLPANREEPHNE